MTGESVRLDGPVVLVEPSPQWPAMYAEQERLIRAALGDSVRLVEHAGSTSVPGLAAKPILDILLAVPDSRDEAAYVPPLEATGYLLAIREPDWYEHRLFRRVAPRVNLHVFSEGCPELDQTLLFRDWLRSHDDDRARYERTKRELAARSWAYVQEYADAKTDVIQSILARARGDGSSSTTAD